MSFDKFREKLGGKSESPGDPEDDDIDWEVKYLAREKKIRTLNAKIRKLDTILNEQAGQLAKFKNTERIAPRQFVDYSALILYCKQNIETDIECEQLFRMGATAKLYNEYYGKSRGGGGWSGAVQKTITIINKMNRGDKK